MSSLAQPDTEAPVDIKMEFVHRQLDDISSTGTPILDGLLLLGCGGYDRLQGGTQPPACSDSMYTVPYPLIGVSFKLFYLDGKSLTRKFTISLSVSDTAVITGRFRFQLVCLPEISPGVRDSVVRV